MRTVVDPPEGWRYGFPKVLDETQTFRKFLLNNGYPRDMLELAEKHSRYWTEEYDEGDEQSGRKEPPAGTTEEPYREGPVDTEVPTTGDPIQETLPWDD